MINIEGNRVREKEIERMRGIDGKRNERKRNILKEMQGIHEIDVEKADLF